MLNTFGNRNPQPAMGRLKPTTIARLLQPNPDLSTQPNDQIPKDQPIPDLNEDYLSEELVRSLRQMIQDRETFGFEQKRKYDDESYYGIKDEFFNNWPWPGASNFQEPITPTMVDVGFTHIHSAMFRDKMKTVNVLGVGKEDRPYAPSVAHVLNWEFGIESNMYQTQIMNSFRTIQKGTGFVKTWVDFGDNFKIKNSSVPLNLIYKHIRGMGCKRGDCQGYHQLIPLTENDWKFRQGIQIGSKNVYKNLEAIVPGWGAGEAFSADDAMLIQQQATGLDVYGSDARDLRYMVESHWTHYPKGKFKAVELIVWWSPKHGLIHRVIENKDMIRTMSDYGIWLNPGFAYQRSAGEILMDIQQKANYTDKQTTDAADKAISQPGYIEEGSGFDPNAHVRVPTGMYEVKKGTKVTFEQTNMAAIIERGNHVDKLWDKAKIRLGFTDIFMGLNTEGAQTLGGDKIRLGKAENRFRALLDIYGIGWGNTCEIAYALTDKNIPNKKLVMILGSSDYQNLEQLFPKEKQKDFGMGLEDAKFNFGIAGKTQMEQEAEDEQHTLFLNENIKLFGTDKGVLWKTQRAKADLIGFKDFERLVPKPIEAYSMSIDEVLQRIESGEVELQPSPMMERVEIEFYKFAVGAFVRTERFRSFNQRQRGELNKYLGRLDSIGTGSNLARLEDMAKTDPAVADALDQLMLQMGGGGGPQPGAPPVPAQVPQLRVA